MQELWGVSTLSWQLHSNSDEEVGDREASIIFQLPLNQQRKVLEGSGMQVEQLWNWGKTPRAVI